MSEDAHNQDPETSKEEVDREDTTLEALFKVADKQDKIRKVLIVYENEDGTYGSEDNGVTMSEALWLVECYRQWIFKSAFRPKD